VAKQVFVFLMQTAMNFIGYSSIISYIALYLRTQYYRILCIKAIDPTQTFRILFKHSVRGAVDLTNILLL